MKRENVRTNQYRSEVIDGMALSVITFVAERLIRYRLVNKAHQIFIIYFSIKWHTITSSDNSTIHMVLNRF